MLFSLQKLLSNILINSFLPSVCKYPSFSLRTSSAHGSQSLKVLKNSSLFQSRRSYDFQVNLSSSRLIYVFLDSKSGLYDLHKLAGIFWSLRVFGIIFLDLTIIICLFSMQGSHNFLIILFELVT